MFFLKANQTLAHLIQMKGDGVADIVVLWIDPGQNVKCANVGWNVNVCVCVCVCVCGQ